jgi:hypothetical protein
MGTTRFPSGVTNSAPRTCLGNMGQPDPLKFHTYFNDFNTYLASDWVVSKTGTGTQALADGDGGLLLTTNSAGVSDAVFNQLVKQGFLMEAGKRAFFKARFKISDATQSAMQLGLIITDTSPLDATDGIYFQKDDGDTHIDLYVRKDTTTGSDSTSDIAELVDNTFITLGFEFDGKQTVFAYVNDVLVARLDASATYLPDSSLTVSFGIQNGEAVAKSMTLDYILAAKER